MRYEKELAKKELNETGKKILAAAETLFLEKGYNAVTTREIAAAAEVNLGLIPYYFGSKEALGMMIVKDMNDRWYDRVFETYTAELGSAERLYIYTVLLWEAMDEPSLKFICEFMEACPSSAQASTTFVDMSWEVIREYKLQVTPLENECYLTAMKGAEQSLVLRQKKQELNISSENISNLILSNYFYNIGLPDKTIAAIIRRCEEFLKK